MSGQEKFDTCRNRSREEHQNEGVAEIGCGSCFKGPTRGYFCWALELPNIVPAICESCVKYRTKEIFN